MRHVEYDYGLTKLLRRQEKAIRTVMMSNAATFIDNEQVAGNGESFRVTNPSSGAEVATIMAASPEDVGRAVGAARSALRGAWSRWSALERGRLCEGIGKALLDQIDEFVAIVSEDAGLPTSLARADVTAAARYFEFYGGLADKLYGQTIPLGPTVLDYTVLEPWGICAVILPFNFPLQLTARSVAAALATGNTLVLKPAEQAPFAPMALRVLCAEVGAPPGVINVVTGLGASTGNDLVRHAEVDHVTFTGSFATGRKIMTAAGELLKPSTIELGGKSPQICFDDGDLPAMVAAVASCVFKTAGQACSASTRILVQRAAYSETLELLAAAAAALTIGAATSNLDVGPIITEGQRGRVREAIDSAVSGGAEIVSGGSGDPVGNGGYYVAPTVLTGVDLKSDAYREEIFGPVVTVTPFADEDEAVALANDSDYGLVAGVWTRDVARAHRVACRVKAGQVFVNNYGVGGGIELPFGGYKRSGIGRLKGVAGALEYTQLKNICVALV